jgi:hypothetical protein
MSKMRSFEAAAELMKETLEVGEAAMLVPSNKRDNKDVGRQRHSMNHR